MKPIIALLVIIILFTSCTSKIYKSPDLQKAITEHKTVAILPAYVTMKLRSDNGEKIPAGQHSGLEQKTGYEIQKNIYEGLLDEKQGTYTITFQDINVTNAKLKEANINYLTMQFKDRKDLAKILGVDAIIDSRLLTGKQTSEGRTAANIVMSGFSGNTKQTAITMNIYDGATGTLIWKLSFKTNDDRSNDTQNLVDKMLEKAIKKFPYKH